MGGGFMAQWTEIKISIDVKDVDKASDIANMVVPYGNVESFRQEHPTEEGDLYMVIDDDFSKADHGMAGTAFYIALGLLERMGTQFTWLTEAVPTGIGDIAAERTGISSTGWYTLDGLKLIGKPSRKGIYICNGRKLALH